MSLPEETSKLAINNDWRWNYSCIDAFEPLVSVKGWKTCPKCKQFPRLWVFDNGRYAKCQCGELYGNPHAEAIAVCPYGRQNNWNFTDYDSSELQKAWNAHVNLLISEIESPSKEIA